MMPLRPEPEAPAVATARRLQEHLRASYKIHADIQSNAGVAILTLGRELHVWVYSDRILWDSGRTDPATRAKACTTVPANQPERAAGLVAGRYHEIHRGQA